MKRVPLKQGRKAPRSNGQRDRSIVLDERAQVQPGNRETAQRAGLPPKRLGRRPTR
jgi:hypothetical protein